jgi:hypothetical protein
MIKTFIIFEKDVIPVIKLSIRLVMRAHGYNGSGKFKTKGSFGL